MPYVAAKCSRQSKQRYGVVVLVQKNDDVRRCQLRYRLSVKFNRVGQRANTTSTGMGAWVGTDHGAGGDGTDGDGTETHARARDP